VYAGKRVAHEEKDEVGSLLQGSSHCKILVTLVLFVAAELVIG
jgi:hypothetical protein